MHNSPVQFSKLDLQMVSSLIYFFFMIRAVRTCTFELRFAGRLEQLVQVELMLISNTSVFSFLDPNIIRKSLSLANLNFKPKYENFAY